MYVLKQHCFSILVIIMSCCASTRSQTLQDAKALRKQLFVTNEYDKSTRPVLNQSEVSIVRMSMGVYLVFELDEVAQTLRVAGFLDITWLDEALVWDPAQYGGLNATFFPQDDVWRPDVSLKDSVEDFKALGDSALNVHVTSDGQVRWQPYHLFSSYCSIDITYYPFDEQMCIMSFVTWSYDKNQIVIRGPVGGEAVTIDFMQQNAEWDLVKATCAGADDPKPMMLFYLTMKRKPRTVIFDVILPLCVLTFLNVSAFLLPSKCGERSGYAVTLFLSFVVYTTIISGSLPANSDSICYLSNFIIVQVCQSSIITVISLLQVRMSTNQTPYPKWFVKVVTSCRKCRRTNVIVPDPREDRENERKRRFSKQLTKTSFVLPYVNEVKGENNTNKKQAKQVCDLNPPSREHLEFIVDVFLFCLFNLVSIVSALSYFLAVM